MNKEELNLEQLKEIELDILYKFDEICEKNNLRYALDSGTLLGAVRHKGFIPWDDDIDVVMPRDDYEKFIRILQKNPPENYGLWSILNYHNYPYFFAKMVRKDTTLTEEQFKHMPAGSVYIDIFPLDALPKNKIHRAWYTFKFNWYQFLISVLAYGKHNKFNPWYIRFCSSFFGLFPISVEKLHRKADEYVQKFSIEQADEITTHFVTFKKEDVLPFKKDMTFETGIFYRPYDTDKYLTNMYGDYMQLPPEDQRKPWHTFKAYFK